MIGSAIRGRSGREDAAPVASVRPRCVLQQRANPTSIMGSRTRLGWIVMPPTPIQRVAPSTLSPSRAAGCRHQGVDHDRVFCAGSCHSGYSAIVSLRTASGAVLSTAELRLIDGDRPCVTVRQHRSVRNGAPTAACERALEALVPRLNDVAAPPHWRRCANSLGPRAEMSRVCSSGYYN